MNNISAVLELLNPDNTLSAHRLLAHAIGMNEALIYSSLISKQIYYQNNEKLSEDGWFYSTVCDLQESTTLKEKAQKSAITHLAELGLIETKCMGMPAKRYFRICDNIEKITMLLDEGSRIAQNISVSVKRNYQKSDIDKSSENKKSSIPDFRSSLPEAGTSSLPESAASTRPESVTSSAVSSDKTKDNKPKIINLNSINPSIGQTDGAKNAPMKFSEVLEAIGIRWYEITANEPEDENHFADWDEADRKTQKCKISYCLKNDKQAFAAALKYLSAYSQYFASGENEESRFFSAVIDSISDMVGQDNISVNGQAVMYYEIIDKLNDIIRRDYLSEWLRSFEERWLKIISENEIRNPRAYMKSCIWSWLNDFEIEQFADEAICKTC